MKDSTVSKAHDERNPVAFTFNGEISNYPVTMTEGDCLVPSQAVINELRGKVYAEWRYAREAFWKAVYKHHGSNFNLPEKQKSKGRGFFARKGGHVKGPNGERRRVEIHHKTHASDNMGMFAELSNFVVLYPNTHDTVHYLDRQEV